MEFEWHIFIRFTANQLCNKVQEFLSKMSKQPEEFTGRIIFMSMFNDISWGQKTTRRNANQMHNSFLSVQRDWEQDNGHSSDLDQKITFAESKHPVFRSTSPLSRGTLKSKGGGKLSIHFCADEGTIETVFHTIIVVNQFSYVRSSLRLVWWVRDLPSKNGETRADRTIWPIVRTSKFVDDNTYTFDRSSRTRRFIAEEQRTSGKALTIKPSDQILYWGRIPDNSWIRTVPYDKGHWRVLTIYRTNDMSWIHFGKRWNIIWPERLDSREH